MTLGLGYKYLNVSSTDFNVEHLTVAIVRARNHSISVTFTMTI